MKDSGTLGVEARDRNNFDFLRFVLASAVIYSHSFVLLGVERGEIFNWITRDQQDGGALAVHGFFAISGYLITISWQKSSGAFDYLRKRALRIYPGFAGMAVLSVLIFAPLAAPSALSFWHSQNWSQFSRHVLTLHNLELTGFSFDGSTGPTTINGSTWTIRIEFECYVMILILGTLGWLKRRWIVLVLFGVTMTLHAASLLEASWLHFIPLPARAMHAHPRLFSYFLAGTILALWRKEWEPKTPLVAASAVALLVTSRFGGFQLIAPIALTYVIFAFVFARRPDLHLFARRGDFSYGIYLYGWPVQQLLIFLLPGRLTPNVLTLLAFVATVALAALSWHFVERPALALKKHRSAARPSIEPGTVQP